MIRVKAGKKNIGYSYEVVSHEEYEKLQQRINYVLDEILQRLRAGEPSVSHSQNGSLKKKTSSKLKAVLPSAKAL
jgi:hypothetical protein